MYTSIEKIPDYAPQTPDIAKIKSNVGGKIRQLLTAALGREFMELPAKGKIQVLYFYLSLALVCAWSEEHIWPNLLNLLNFANAARLANKTMKKRVPRD